jgi:hypothetical protein
MINDFPLFKKNTRFSVFDTPKKNLLYPLCDLSANGDLILVDIVQMSADSKVFNRTPFRGPLGACLCFRNPVDFAKSYGEFFDSFFKKKGTAREKEVYSGSDVSRIFERDRTGFLSFLESFVTKIR